MSKLKMTRGNDNVFADLGFDAEEAQNLMLRSQTMMAVERWYKASGLTQVKAANALGITQPRLCQMLKGRIEEFSLDALVNMAARAGMRIGMTIKPAPKMKPLREISKVSAATSAKRVDRQMATA